MKHVIFFDNGQSYEDNRQTAVCIAPDGKTAIRVEKQLTAWLERMRERFPQIDGGEAREHEAWLEAVDKRRTRINRIRCPYGCGDIRDGVQDGVGNFFRMAVPDVQL